MKPTALVQLALFALFLGAPGIAFVVGVEGGGTTLENRALKKRPVLTAKALWDGSWGKGFSDWVWDEIPLRDVFLRLDHRVDTFVFRDSPAPAGVVFGERGYVFTRERVFGRRAGGVDQKKLLRAVDNITNAFASAEVRFFLVVSPNKATLYPELLPPRHRAEHKRTVVPVVKALEKLATTGPAVLNLWEPLRAEKARLDAATDLPDERLRSLYRAYDDHWSVETGRIQAREIVTAIDPQLWDERFAPVIGAYGEAESEISKIYLKTGEREPYATLDDNPLVALSEKRVKISGGHSLNELKSATTSTFTPRPLRLAVIRDSFMSGAPKEPVSSQDGGIETVATFFAESLFIHWDVFATETRAVTEKMKGADVVVVQVTQGNLANVIAHEARLVKLAGELR